MGVDASSLLGSECTQAQKSWFLILFALEAFFFSTTQASCQPVLPSSPLPPLTRSLFPKLSD